MIKPILPPFKNWALQNFPFIEDDFDMITNYQLYCKIVEYMKSVDTYMQGVNTFLTEVQNYFDNLDVTEEIDQKLDELVTDGTLANLVKPYFDTYIQPQINNQNNLIQYNFENQDNKIAEQDDKIDSIEDMVNSLSSGSPRGVYSTLSDLETEDPNHSYIYLVSADGNWYYYDSVDSEWKAGGLYQSTGLADNIVKYNNLDTSLQNNICPINGVVGTITTTGAIYTGSVGNTATATTLSGFQCGEIDNVNEGDFISIPYCNVEMNLGANYAVAFVDSNNVILAGYTINDFKQTIDGVSRPKPTILKAPADTAKVIFNNKITDSTFNTSATQFYPVKITEYNYSDSRISQLLNKKELIEATSSSNVIDSLQIWNVSIGGFRTDIYSVKPLELMRIERKIANINYLTTAIFTDNDDKVIGYIAPFGTTSGVTTVAEDFTVPAFATKMYVCNRTSDGEPKVYKYNVSDEDNTLENKVRVNYTDGVLTLSGINNSITFENFGGNNLFMIKSFSVGDTTKTLYTDMIPAPYIVKAINNADGDKESSIFTGGNHQWNNSGSGSTPTAREISKNFYADGNIFSIGNTTCNLFTIVETNRVQGWNTCKEDGTGREILEEKIVFTYDGIKLHVINTIKPLEEIQIDRYYGIQTGGFNNSDYIVYADKLYDVNTQYVLNERPYKIFASNIVSSMLYNCGLGTYKYNTSSVKVNISNNKSYFAPIYNNTINFTTSDIVYIEGEYLFELNQK